MSKRSRPKAKKKAFIGGPYDGYPVSESDEEYPVHTFDCGEKMAVYEWDKPGRFVFVGMADNDGGSHRVKSREGADL